MTGELFALLAGASVLRHSRRRRRLVRRRLRRGGRRDARPAPSAWPARLFGIRAEGLLAGLAPERARARLSGLLIGAELAAARPYWLGREVALIGAPALAAAYRDALALCGPRRARRATPPT